MIKSVIMNILKLPKYVLIEIFSFLQSAEICLLSITCAAFNKTTESDSLWNAIPGSGDGLKLKHNFCIHSSTLHNIHSKKYQINILSGHLKQINAICIKENKVITCSEDKSVHLWNLKQKKANKIITHSDIVISADFYENGVVSISLDKNMKIWRKNQKVKTIRAHTDGVTQLNKINENKCITGGRDGLIKIWDVVNGANLTSINEFNFGVDLIENDQQHYCFASSGTRDAFVRDFEKPEILMRLK